MANWSQCEEFPKRKPKKAGRRAARPMERVPLPSQIAFLPCTSHPKDSSKARSPIGRETLGHWSNESINDPRSHDDTE
ncbi:hypothetical protein TNCV_4984961 [Trichonephila clavipes]|nr:hypothetical protein TNCV_4984961 [Trichonephila clavipes]